MPPRSATSSEHTRWNRCSLSAETVATTRLAKYESQSQSCSHIVGYGLLVPLSFWFCEHGKHDEGQGAEHLKWQEREHLTRPIHTHHFVRVFPHDLDGNAVKWLRKHSFTRGDPEPDSNDTPAFSLVEVLTQLA
ncbi:MAG: hypothetical protein FWD57_16015, partial [Polyangiaceae bacterium]|nr:hypothetical protein [Polyangiaceae bacterium]